jgi:hypothetical protein
MQIWEESKGHQKYFKKLEMKNYKNAMKMYRKTLKFLICKAHWLLRYTQALRVL